MAIRGGAVLPGVEDMQLSDQWLAVKGRQLRLPSRLAHGDAYQFTI